MEGMGGTVWPNDQEMGLGSDGPGFEYQLHHLLAVRLEVLPVLLTFSSVKCDT